MDCTSDSYRIRMAESSAAFREAVNMRADNLAKD
jgi:hypothetical protein